MKRLILLDTAQVPGGGGEIGLYQLGDDYIIKVAGGQDLMSTRTHGSADALAEIACKAVSSPEQARVLIGGLGMGFTLATALRHLGPDADVVVSELVPAVVGWNRGATGESSGHPLRDKRVTVLESDVGVVLREKVGAWDAIMLDVDNGPEGLTKSDNDWLYSGEGLHATYQALRPKGVLTVWSAHGDKGFTKRLRRVGFEADEVVVRAHRGKGSRHVIWLARKGG
jgi:spermidine synthase